MSLITPVEKVDIVVIGAGVLGCAIAYELSTMGYCPWILEQGVRVGEGVTSRNSGVVHAGIYYQPESIKADSCVSGKFLLYEWCEKMHVPHKKVGKWIVGDKSEENELRDLYENAKKCGVSELEWHGRLPSELGGVHAQLGLFSPLSGIVDPYDYSRSFQKIAEENGAFFCFNTEVKEVQKERRGYRIFTSREDIESDVVVNAAGLHSDWIARGVGIDKYQIYPCRGDYFKLRSNLKFKNLIYPVKKKGAAGLGIHLTLALDGSYRLGPDAYYVSSRNDFGEPIQLQEKKIQFYEAAKRYLALSDRDELVYDSCGIRPKLRSPCDSEELDFVVAEDLPGFINVIGIESPGLTAARSLAKRVVQFL